MNAKDKAFLKKLCENSCELLELFRILSCERQDQILAVIRDMDAEERDTELPTEKKVAAFSPGAFAAGDPISLI